uniref:Uncharacterized protein n=1 Tax=Glossina palpalis gambiensis TaxID=67801 RepID=A0A1B0BWD8_9MUSC
MFLFLTFKYYQSRNRNIAEQQEKGAIVIIAGINAFRIVFSSLLFFSFQNPNEFLSEIYISVHSLEPFIIPCSLIGLLEKKKKKKNALQQQRYNNISRPNQQTICEPAS